MILVLSVVRLSKTFNVFSDVLGFSGAFTKLESVSFLVISIFLFFSTTSVFSFLFSLSANVESTFSTETGLTVSLVSLSLACALLPRKIIAPIVIDAIPTVNFFIPYFNIPVFLNIYFSLKKPNSSSVFFLFVKFNILFL